MDFFHPKSKPGAHVLPGIVVNPLSLPLLVIQAPVYAHPAQARLTVPLPFHLQLTHWD